MCSSLSSSDSPFSSTLAPPPAVACSPTRCRLLAPPAVACSNVRIHFCAHMIEEVEERFEANTFVIWLLEPQLMAPESLHDESCSEKCDVL
ncbi:hypothetical protein PVAP13_3KG128268 [Panicum virgatum]|uniref:Uncharacterized protein n=1 Tax=Panicum virgatum TaxID=38727 RepID=A0A8T0V233_PANVG|nr:hypothetical protein PVAP13_3KG128268 [Panicum virgatum]KAG2627556.1 hypothetical protein PVAP13_3KG128268 [Panicum virgatum]